MSAAFDFDEVPTEQIEPLQWLCAALFRVHRRPHAAVRFFVVMFGE